MNPRNTWLWVVAAAGLFAFIFFYERHTHKPEPGPVKVLPGLKALEIKSVLVLPQGQRAIQVERTNGIWRLTEPLDYPAQAMAIDNLLAVLQVITAAPYISPEEIKNLPGADEQFGFDSPQASLMLGQKKFHVLIGNKTAFGDQVFVQVVGKEGVYVVDAALLKFVPKTADDWREHALVDWSQLVFDRLIITNAGKTLELQNNPADRVWRMILPMNTRADSALVEGSLQHLLKLQVRQFVADGDKIDLESFGLQPPELSMEFFLATNHLLRLEFGKSPTNDDKLVYARRADRNTVVTVPKDSYEPWLASHSDNFRDFLDRHLVALTSWPDRIEVQAQDNFILQRQTNETWRILPADLPADPILLKEFVTNLVSLKATAIEKDLLPEQDLPEYGLLTPARQYTLSVETNSDAVPTNLVVAHLQFGIQDDKVHARRAGEDFVYAIKPEDLDRLPALSWQMRDRQLWKFASDEVARLTVHQGSNMLAIVHNGTNSWSVAPGTQGSIKNTLALEEVAHQLGDVFAAKWVARGDEERAHYGFTPDGLSVAIELKDGRTFLVEFGGTAPSQFPYAITTLDQQPWIFEFPWSVYQFVQLYLTIPENPH